MWVGVTNGVLWGSILRPMSFLAYVNDFSAGLESSLNMFVRILNHDKTEFCPRFNFGQTHD